MTIEEAFAESIRESPDDDTPRLIYADWLDEQGREEEAVWMRADVTVRNERPVDPVVYRKWQSFRMPEVLSRLLR